MSEAGREDKLSRHLRAGEFYGEVLQKYRHGGLVLSELRHEHGRRLPAHTHELAYFCLLLDGAYSEQLGRRQVSYRPLTIAFHPPATTHRDEIGRGGGRFFSIELQDHWLERLREYAPASDFAPAEAQGGELVWLALRMYREYSAPDACSPLVIEGLLMEMLATAARSRPAAAAEARPPLWLARALDLIHAEFRTDLTVGRIAAAVGVHPFHLSKVFRRFRRRSVGDYVQELRVAYACRQLSRPDAALAAIALDAGFSDQSHFTRVCKRLTGTTPGVLRRTLVHDARRD